MNNKSLKRLALALGALVSAWGADCAPAIAQTFGPVAEPSENSTFTFKKDGANSDLQIVQVPLEAAQSNGFATGDYFGVGDGALFGSGGLLVPGLPEAGTRGSFSGGSPFSGQTDQSNVFAGGAGVGSASRSTLKSGQSEYPDVFAMPQQTSPGSSAGVAPSQWAWGGRNALGQGHLNDDAVLIQASAISEAIVAGGDSDGTGFEASIGEIDPAEARKIQLSLDMRRAALDAYDALSGVRSAMAEVRLTINEIIPVDPASVVPQGMIRSGDSDHYATAPKRRMGENELADKIIKTVSGILITIQDNLWAILAIAIFGLSLTQLARRR